MAEGYIGNVKVFLSKKGLLGNGASREATLNALAGAWLMDNPGIDALGKAMKKFIQHRMAKVCPKDCFNADFLNDFK